MMKLTHTCMECQKEKGRPSFEFVLAEVRDDGVYKLTCREGHATTTFLSSQKYQILFQIGANAIHDGYYREAVSSFASALERFYEYTIRLACFCNDMSDELLEKLWKEVRNQSERQLGAYVFLWPSLSKTPPHLLKSGDSSFRNSVIHKGKIPTRAEAENFGEKIYHLIGDALTDIHANVPVETMLLAGVKKNGPNADDFKHGNSISTLSVPTVIQMFGEPNEYYAVSFADRLTELGEQRKFSEGFEPGGEINLALRALSDSIAG